MSEKRGSKTLKSIDRQIGRILLLFLIPLLGLKRLICCIHTALLSPKEPKLSHTPANTENCLLVCFGAIGDLILLTQAAKHQLGNKRIFLACTNSNKACAELYKDFYVGIKIIDIRSLRSILDICNQHQIKWIYDSTQWANIGPILTGIARLFGSRIHTVGFHTESYLRNKVYTHTVEHSTEIHEVGNFINLLAAKPILSSNIEIRDLMAALVDQRSPKQTKKILLHLWPSGTRSHLKEWPMTYWVKLVQYLSHHGYEIYLSGSQEDAPRNQKLITQSGLPLINIAGKLNLIELKNFIASDVEIAICVNTGILHLAASQGVPVIGLHGPTNPNRWGPLGIESKVLLPRSGLSAYLHYGFEYPKDDQTAYSLDKLDVSQVIDALKLIKHHS